MRSVRDVYGSVIFSDYICENRGIGQGFQNTNLSKRNDLNEFRYGGFETKFNIELGESWYVIKFQRCLINKNLFLLIIYDSEEKNVLVKRFYKIKDENYAITSALYSAILDILGVFGEKFKFDIKSIKPYVRKNLVELILKSVLEE